MSPARSSRNQEVGADRGDGRDGRKKARERRPVNAASLAAVAVAYLNRRDASGKQLQRRLETWVVQRGEPPDPLAARPLIVELIARYERSGLVNDKRLAENITEHFRARGNSSRKIQARLSSRGLSSGVIDEVLAAEREAGSEPELAAARALVRKRKLGLVRPAAERAENRRRDLAILARAGFSFDIARRALGSGRDEDDEF
jgi:regulatory protein